MFEGLKLTQRLKGFGKLCLASMLWLLVRPISVAVSAPIYVVARLIVYVGDPFCNWAIELENDPRESKAKQIKYWLSSRLITFFFGPILYILCDAIIYHIALFNQRIGGIIGDYSCVFLVYGDAKIVQKAYVHASNWFEDGWSELFTSPAATPEKPPATPEKPPVTPEKPPATPEVTPATPEIPPTTPAKDDPSSDKAPLSATRPSPDNMRSVTSDPVVDNSQATLQPH